MIRTAVQAFAVGLVLAMSMSAVSGQPVLTLRATVVGTAPAETLRVELLRWSADEERAPLMAAATPPPPAPPDSPAPAPPAGTGTGAAPPPASGAKPQAAGGDAAPDAGAPPQPAPNAAAPARAGGPPPAQAGAAPPAAAAAGRGRGARGAAGRGARAAEPQSPAERLTAALKAAPTVGYIWGDGVTGYAIKYAWRAQQPDGTERIVLVTDRRLGSHSHAWPAVAGSAADAPTANPAAVQAGTGPTAFTAIEMRVGANGTGEAKTSLTTGVVVDAAAQTLAVDGYGALPVLLKIER